MPEAITQQRSHCSIDDYSSILQQLILRFQIYSLYHRRFSHNLAGLGQS